MIDIENIVFTAVADAVRARFLPTYPDLKVYGEEVPIPESFPCVTIAMTDNYTNTRTLEFGKLRENHANVAFRVNVYTNNAKGRKALAKAIFNTVDETLQDLKLTRMFGGEAENIDRTIYRYTGRYTGTVAAGVTHETDGEEVTLFRMNRTY